MSSDPRVVADRIAAVLTRPQPLLFAGAGVGVRVGLPDWVTYLSYLASECQRFDSDDAAAIRSRTQKGHLLGAATVFKSCESIPIGERYRLLAAPFTSPLQDASLDLLEPLLGLGFTAAVTTNYDHSLLHAATRARSAWTRPVELADASMKGASTATDFFIARIHGRAELPQTMVVAHDDYGALLKNPDYLDFVMDILRSRACLFCGFSFLDPAIDHILTLYADRFGPHYPQLHAALVPSSAGSLVARLHALNIEAIEYDPAGAHLALWQASPKPASARRQRTRAVRGSSRCGMRGCSAW